MDLYTPPTLQTIRGIVRVPGDKSITHRALLLAALAEGRSRVRNALIADDTERTAAALRAMGVQVPPLTPELQLAGRGGERLREAEDVVDCGNSGTTLRLLAGAVAGHDHLTVLTGDSSLRCRPMDRIVKPLRLMGAAIQGRAGGLYPPLAIRGGRLRDLQYRSPMASAQVKSCLLLAGLGQEVTVEVEEPLPSRDHTERLLTAMGARITAKLGYVRLEGGTPLRPLDLEVPGDFSAAAFFLVLTLLHPDAELRVPRVNLNPTRTGLLAVLRRMGARLEEELTGEEGGEPVGTVRAYSSSLRGTVVERGEIPALVDEVPILATLAARASGETEIRGAEELRLKESDRLRAMAENLRALGISVEELTDGLAIVGSDHPLRGRVSSFGDHRVAMAFAVLGALPGQEITVDGFDAVSASYPTFAADLEGLG